MDINMVFKNAIEEFAKDSKNKPYNVNIMNYEIDKDDIHIMFSFWKKYKVSQNASGNYVWSDSYICDLKKANFDVYNGESDIDTYIAGTSVILPKNVKYIGDIKINNSSIKYFTFGHNIVADFEHVAALTKKQKNNSLDTLDYVNNASCEYEDIGIFCDEACDLEGLEIEIMEYNIMSYNKSCDVAFIKYSS